MHTGLIVPYCKCNCVLINPFLRLISSQFLSLFSFPCLKSVYCSTLNVILEAARTKIEIRLFLALFHFILHRLYGSNYNTAFQMWL